MIDQEERDYFQYHNANMRLINIGFEAVRRQIKHLFTQRDRSDIHIYLREDGDKEKVDFAKC